MTSVLLVDCRQPMSYTSAHSGDNYRNWWPHRTMVDFTNDSIDELDRLASESNNAFNMTRGGYVLATRSHDISAVIDSLRGNIEVDIYEGQRATQGAFPALDTQVQNVLHIRRGGDICGQLLGQFLLEKFRAAGGKVVLGEVKAINSNGGYRLEVVAGRNANTVTADLLVNAAGPFVANIARMMGVDLPIENVYQQKIAFEDHLNAIP